MTISPFFSTPAPSPSTYPYPIEVNQMNLTALCRRIVPSGANMLTWVPSAGSDVRLQRGDSYDHALGAAVRAVLSAAAGEGVTVHDGVLAAYATIDIWVPLGTQQQMEKVGHTMEAPLLQALYMFNLTTDRNLKYRVQGERGKPYGAEYIDLSWSGPA